MLLSPKSDRSFLAGGRAISRIEQVFAHPARRVPGSAKGKIVITDDFDFPLPENVLADFEP